MSVSYINYKGNEILYIDYSQCKTVEDSLNVLDLVKEEVLKTKGSMLTLHNFNGAFGSSAYMKKADEYAKKYFNQKTAKNAVLGIEGLKKILLLGHNTVSKNKLIPFSTREEALEYLVS